MSVKNKAKDRDSRGKIPRKYTAQRSKFSLNHTPSWHVTLYMSRPRRRENRRVCAAILQGADPDTIRTMIQKSRSSRPVYDLAEFENELEYARVFGITGMTSEAIEILESILQPPSKTSVYTVDLDPAFDAIRNNPDFVTMLERYR